MTTLLLSEVRKGDTLTTSTGKVGVVTHTSPHVIVVNYGKDKYGLDSVYTLHRSDIVNDVAAGRMTFSREEV
jgi:preprotein translocase subunit YajC